MSDELHPTFENKKGGRCPVCCEDIILRGLATVGQVCPSCRAHGLGILADALDRIATARRGLCFPPAPTREAQPLSAASAEPLDAATLRGDPASDGEGHACECPARKALEAYRFLEQTKGGVNPHPGGSNRYRAFELMRAALSAPCPCGGLRAKLGQNLENLRRQIISEYIEENSIRCECCQHVFIDVTAKDGEQQHAIAGDPEGEGSGCAWSFDNEVVPQLRNALDAAEAERDSLRDELEVWRQQETPGIAACMRLNAKLTARADQAEERERVLRDALVGIRDNAEASYWELRHWLDTHPKLDRIRGDDGPCYPFLQLAKRAGAALATPEGISQSLLRSVDATPKAGCYCKPGRCMAPVIMGVQMPCRDPQKAAATPEGAPFAADDAAKERAFRDRTRNE